MSRWYVLYNPWCADSTTD